MHSMSSSELPVPSIAPRTAAAWLVGAAALFWASWAAMPGVGITDTAEIFARVQAHTDSVRLSVVLQLASAACYAPALLAIVQSVRGRWPFVGAALMLLGAMGSAADAVLHLLAVEMVAPGIDRAAMVPVMERMQGPDLRLLAPLFASFFVGSLVLAVVFARRRLVARPAPWLFAGGVACAVAAGVVSPSSPVAARWLALGLLGCVAALQAWLGLAFASRR